MKTIWKKASVGLVMDNEERYGTDFKTYRLANVVENPDSAKLMEFGKAYAKLTGDELSGVELTTVTQISEDI